MSDEAAPPRLFCICGCELSREPASTDCTLEVLGAAPQVLFRYRCHANRCPHPMFRVLVDVRG